MGQPVQIAGAVALLIGFVLAQVGVLTQRSTWYLVLNLVGSAVLTVDAYLGRQWGFFLLEGVWAIVSAWSLLNQARGA
jgi:membrane-bound ClpP family serine protease